MANNGYSLLRATSKWGVSNIGKIDSVMYKNACKLEEMLVVNMVNMKDVDIVLGRLNRFYPSGRISSLLTDYFGVSNPSVNDIALKYNLSTSRVYNLITDLYKMLLKDWVIETFENGWPAFSNKMNIQCAKVRQGVREDISLKISDFLFPENVEVQIIRNKLSIRNDSILSLMVCYDNLWSQFKRGELVSLSVTDLKVLAKALFDATLLDSNTYYEVAGIQSPQTNQSVLSNTQTVKKVVHKNSNDLPWFTYIVLLAKGISKDDVVKVNKIRESCNEFVVLPLIEKNFNLVERHILINYFKDKKDLYEISQQYSVSVKEILKVLSYAMDLFGNISNS